MGSYYEYHPQVRPKIKIRILFFHLCHPPFCPGNNRDCSLQTAHSSALLGIKNGKWQWGTKQCLFISLAGGSSFPAITQQENSTEASKLMCGSLEIKTVGKDSNVYAALVFHNRTFYFKSAKPIPLKNTLPLCLPSHHHVHLLDPSSLQTYTQKNQTFFCPDPHFS